MYSLLSSIREHEAIRVLKERFDYNPFVNVWMIHEVSYDDIHEMEKLFTSKDNDILVWDDALLSQYAPIQHFLGLGFTNILAVSSAIASRATEQSLTDEYQPVAFSASSDAHTLWFKSQDASAFMTWEHINSLARKKVYIAVHGHTHAQLPSRVKEGLPLLHREVKEAQQCFRVNLGYSPCVWVYPYNKEFPASTSVLRNYGFQIILGAGRKNVQKYLENGKALYT